MLLVAVGSASRRLVVIADVADIGGSELRIRRYLLASGSRAPLLIGLAVDGPQVLTVSDEFLV